MFKHVLAAAMLWCASWTPVLSATTPYVPVEPEYWSVTTIACFDREDAESLLDVHATEGLDQAELLTVEFVFQGRCRAAIFEISTSINLSRYISSGVDIGNARMYILPIGRPGGESDIYLLMLHTVEGR